MLETLPKVWGIALAAAIGVVAFVLWFAFQTAVGREAAALNLRIVADAVPYNGSWVLAVFNLGPAVNITGVWTARGLVQVGRVLGMGQNTTLQLAVQPLKVQACAVGHASACELVEVAGWAIHVVEFAAAAPKANTTLIVSVTCTSASLGFSVGYTDTVANWKGTTIKKYIFSTASPIYVVGLANNGQSYKETLLPGKTYSWNITDICPILTVTTTEWVTAYITSTVGTVTVTTTGTTTSTQPSPTTPPPTTPTSTTTQSPPPCQPIEISVYGGKNSLTATAQLSCGWERVSNWYWDIKGNNNTVNVRVLVVASLNGKRDLLSGSWTLSFSCPGASFVGSTESNTVTVPCK